MKKLLLLLMLIVPSLCFADISDHWTARSGIITFQSGQIGANPILRIGDSISEQMWMGLPTNPATLQGNNAQVLNAGLMGIGVYDLLPHTQYFLSLVNPWVVMFQIGTNDALASSTFNAAPWLQSLKDNVTAMLASPYVELIAVKSIPPTSNISSGYSQDTINQMNVLLEAVADLYPNVIYIDLNPYLMCESTGYARPGYLLDDAHLSGSATWTVAWVEYCFAAGIALPVPPNPC